MLLMLILQVLSSLILFQFVEWARKKYKLKVNIHNFPIIVFTLLLLTAGIYLCFYYMKIYLLIGFFIGGVIYIMLSTVDEKQPLLSKVVAGVIASIIWHQILIFMFFYFYNSEKIDIDE